jgi:hypothetical protein
MFKVSYSIRVRQNIVPCEVTFATRKMAETFSGITYGSKIERIYTDGELFDLWSQGQIDTGAW